MANRCKDPFHSNFKGIWIHASLYKIQGLSPLHRELLSFISSFGKKDDCYASNAYMSKLFSVSIKTIKNALRTLKKKELIRSCGPDKYHRVLKLNRPVIERLIWEEQSRVKNAPVKGSGRDKSRVVSSSEVGENLSHSGVDSSQTRVEMGPLTNKDNKNRKEKTKGGATRFKASTAFIEKVFITRQGKRFTLYTRPKQGSSEWFEQQKRLVGVG